MVFSALFASCKPDVVTSSESCLTRVCRFARLVASVAGALLWSAVLSSSAHANPTRLRLKIEGPPVTVGSTIQLLVELLNDKSQTVKNDRDRTVRLEVLGTGSSKEGRGRIAPNLVKVPAGSSTCSTARFTAEVAGTVLVRVTSDGLAPGEAVVRITSGSPPPLARLFLPTLHAQERESFEILPRNHEPFPRNGKSRAHFSINVASPPRGGPLKWRVSTDPAVEIKYGESTSKDSPIVTIEPGEYLSAAFEIFPPSKPGRVRVRAEFLPAGRTDEVEVVFVAPQPVRASFERESYKANSEDRVVPLNFHLLDKDGIALQDLAESHEIRLQSADASSDAFEPATVTLSGAQPHGTSNLRLPWLHFGRDLKVLAGGDALATGVAEVAIIATELAVLLMAMIGGFLGGISRHVYLVGTPYLLPRRTKNRLDPGLVGNALLSALAGVVIFLAVDLGILHGVLGLEDVHDTAALGFVLGVAGGFAGARAFEVLTERVLLRKMAVETSG
jgi:hypothetical protein